MGCFSAWELKQKVAKMISMESEYGGSDEIVGNKGKFVCKMLKN